MSTEQPTVDTTRRSATQIIDDFFRPGGFLDQHYPGKKAYFKTNLTSAFLDYLASLGETFYLAAALEAEERLLLTARQAGSILDIAASYGYNYRGPLAATVRARLSVDYLPELIIPVLRASSDPNLGTTVVFESTADIVKPAGQSYVDLLLVQGETSTAATTISSGTPAYQASLDSKQVVALDSLKVQVNGVVWTRKATLLESGPSDRHYRVRFREDIPGSRVYYVEFGDSVNGLIPPAGATVEVSARTCAGLAGRVPKGLVNQLLSQISAPDGTQLRASILSTEDTVGGANEETIEEIRQAALGTLVTNARSVSNPDYGYAAFQAGARRAMAITRSEWAVVPVDTVLVVVAKELATLPSGDLDEIASTMKQIYPPCGTVRLLTVSAAIVGLQVEVDVTCTAAANLEDVRLEVVNRMIGAGGLLTLDGRVFVPDPRWVLDIGQPVAISWIYEAVQPIRGVHSVSVRLKDETGKLYTKPDGSQGDAVPLQQSQLYAPTLTVHMQRATRG
jgi:hypothetical protein